MIMKLTAVLLFALVSVAIGNDTCDVEQQDPTVYLFGYGYSFGPYEYLNDDGELMGLGYDIVRTVCKTMNKKCEHAVYYDYNLAYNDQKISPALNGRWYHALVNWVYTKERVASYELCEEYAKEPASYIYVRSGSSMHDISDVKSDAKKIGFRTGFRTNEECLEKYLGVSLASKAMYYDNQEDLEAALRNDDVDAIFTGEIELVSPNNVKRIGNEAITCASGGMSIMYRKDTSMPWFREGVLKMKDNGDYQWICSMNGNPGCLDV